MVKQLRYAANKYFQVINYDYSAKNFLMITIKSYYLVYNFLRSRFVGKDRYIGNPTSLAITVQLCPGRQKSSSVQRLAPIFTTKKQRIKIQSNNIYFKLNYVGYYITG